jgi:hypothetical protein
VEERFARSSVEWSLTPSVKLEDTLLAEIHKSELPTPDEEPRS